MVGFFSCNTEKLQHLRNRLAEASQGQVSGISGKVIQEHEPARSKNRAGTISKSEAEKIAVDYVAGKSTKQLAEELGRSRAAISESLKRSGVEMRMFRKSSPEEIQQMIALYESGLSLVCVAERVGHSEKTVWVQLRRAGVEMRTANGVDARGPLSCHAKPEGIVS